MLSNVLALITCAAIPVEQPLDVAAEMSPSTPAVEVGAHVTSTSFRCRNFTASNYILVFGRSGSSITVTVPLPPNAILEYAASPEAIQGTYLEVVAVPSPTDFVSSGSIALALPANSTDASLWFVPGIAALVTWRQLGCEVELVRPSSSLLPTSWAELITEDGEYATVQVPVRVPTGPATSSPPPQSLPPM